MNDPTNFCLEYALLDQKIAGAMEGKSYAYVAVMRANGEPYGAGIAVEGEHGYHPIEGIGFDKCNEAESFCLGMNQHIGLDAMRTMQIVMSSMGPK